MLTKCIDVQHLQCFVYLLSTKYLIFLHNSIYCSCYWLLSFMLFCTEAALWLMKIWFMEHDLFLIYFFLLHMISLSYFCADCFFFFIVLLFFFAILLSRSMENDFFRSEIHGASFGYFAFFVCLFCFVENKNIRFNNVRGATEDLLFLCKFVSHIILVNTEIARVVNAYFLWMVFEIHINFVSRWNCVALRWIWDVRYWYIPYWELALGVCGRWKEPSI